MRVAYEYFPEPLIHEKKVLTAALSNKKLQKKLVQLLQNINRKTFTFEEISNPTVPGCTVIFELGITDTMNFNYIDEEETKKVLAALKKETFRIMDFFCAIRYYTDYASLKKPLKFDYYMIRFIFPNENLVELQIYHERGPRYIPPKALVAFLLDKVNETSTRAILKETEEL